MKSQLPYEYEDAFKRILRKNDAPLTGALIDNLGQFINWVIEVEEAKGSLNRNQETPIPLISLLGNMGIYGKNYVDKVPVEG
jgi:hypothetical protein